MSVIGNFYGIMQVMGLASVVGQKIKLFYPNQSFHFLEAFQIDFRPKTELQHNSNCNLLCTNSNGWKDKSTPFVANHFVPLVVVTKPLKANIETSDETICHEPKSILNYFQPNSKSEIPSSYEIAQEPMDMLPLQMDQSWWYLKIGKNVISNRKRDIIRSKDCSVELINGSLEEAVDKVSIKWKEATGKEKEHIHAIWKVGRYIIENGPQVMTQDIVKNYREIKQLNSKSNIMSKEMYEKLIKYYPAELLLVKEKSFILERNFLAVAKAMQSCYQDGISHELLLSHVRNKIGPVYQKALEYLDTKVALGCETHFIV